VKKLAHLFRYFGVIAAFVMVLAIVKGFVYDIAVLPPGVSLDDAWWTISFQIVAWLAFATFCVLQIISVFYIFSEGADSARDTLNVAMIGTLAPATVVLIFANIAVSCAGDAGDAGLAHAETDADGRVNHPGGARCGAGAGARPGAARKRCRARDRPPYGRAT
jgi:hypothetical protein